MMNDMACMFLEDAIRLQELPKEGCVVDGVVEEKLVWCDDEMSN
jgi:hypothetical protein